MTAGPADHNMAPHRPHNPQAHKRRQTNPARETALCAFCPKLCRYVCPVAEGLGSEAATPTAKGALLLDYLQGRRELAGAVTQSAYMCTDCRAQNDVCLHNIDAPDLYGHVRQDAVRQGVAPPAITALTSSHQTCGNAFGTDLTALARAAEPKWPSAGARRAAALLPGCSTLSCDLESVQEACHVLYCIDPHKGPALADVAGLCCGQLLHASGAHKAFVAHARQFAQAANTAAQDLIVMDPACAYALKELYPRFDIQLTVKVSTFVDHLHDRLPQLQACISTPQTNNVAYHDPCFLGRYLGQYDQPRALVAAASGGRRPTEFENNRTQSQCCGAGGVYSRIWPTEAAVLAGRRLDTLVDQDVDTIVTPCPRCRSQLTAEGRYTVQSIASLLARALSS